MVERVEPASLIESVEALSACDRERFGRMFSVELMHGGLKVPEGLVSKVIRWFGEDGVERAESQSIISTRNEFTCEMALFNPLRAQRPNPLATAASKPPPAPHPMSGCDFCNPLLMTAADEWGRCESECCITASNAAKCFGRHGLTIFRAHDPIKSLTRAGVTEALQLGCEWSIRSHVHDCNCRSHNISNYPVIFWNCNRKAAASQEHGHMQPVLSPHRPPGGLAELCQRAEALFEVDKNRSKGESVSGGRAYVDEFLWCHQAVGLASPVIPKRTEADSCTVWICAHLTPKKEKEIVVIGPAYQSVTVQQLPTPVSSQVDSSNNSNGSDGSNGSDIADDLLSPRARVAAFIATRAMVAHMGVDSFNGVFMLPALSTPDTSTAAVAAGAGRAGQGTESLRILARIVDRGPTSSTSVDVGSMELYGGSAVCSTPHSVQSAINAAISEWQSEQCA